MVEDKSFTCLLCVPRWMPSLSSHRGWWLVPMHLQGTLWPAVVWTTCAPSTTSRARMGTSRSCVSWRHTQVGQHLAWKFNFLKSQMLLHWGLTELEFLLFTHTVSWGSSYSISLVGQATCPAVVSSVIARSLPALETALGENIVWLIKLKTMLQLPFSVV